MTIPNSCTTRNKGSMIASIGTIIKAMINNKITFFSGNLNLANAYPAMELIIRPRTTVIEAYIKLFSKFLKIL
ncbi:hypothetical protein D3C77_580740 [compost metagenome]